MKNLAVKYNIKEEVLTFGYEDKTEVRSRVNLDDFRLFIRSIGCKIIPLDNPTRDLLLRECPSAIVL